MGFYLRKAFNFGPLRLNLSKSGLGVSFGVKGARISTGPRGAYVHMGRYGLYYRQRIDGPGGSDHPPTSPPEQPGEQSPSDSPHRIETADVSKLVDVSSKQLLSQINQRARRIALAPFLLAATLLLALVTAHFSIVNFPSGHFGWFATAAVLVLGFGWSWKLHQRDKINRTTPLFYELDTAAAERFTAIQSACQSLAHAAGVWRIETEQAQRDWKYHAGATSSITRRTATVGRINPPFISTNVEVWGIDVGAFKVLFFPDHVLVLQGKTYGAVSYGSLGVVVRAYRFIEDGSVPSDAEIVGQTWQYVNRSGGPDRRFANNRQLPIALYSQVEIRSAEGLNLHLHVSNQALADRFVKGLNSVCRTPFQENRRGEEPSADRPRTAGSSPEAQKPAYDTLGIPVGASLDEITAAYHRMAQLYHPDKVAGLAPEFRVLAEKRMKEINAAYEQLKQRAQTTVVTPSPSSPVAQSPFREPPPSPEGSSPSSKPPSPAEANLPQEGMTSSPGSPVAQSPFMKPPVSPGLRSGPKEPPSPPSPREWAAFMDKVHRSSGLCTELLRKCGADQWEGVYELAREAYELTPTTFVRYYRGLGAAQEGRFEEAEQDVLAAWQERSDPFKWLRNKLEEWENVMGRGAVEPMLDHLKLPLKEREIAHNLAVLYYKTSRFAEARSWAERALDDREPGLSDLQIVAMCLYKTGDFRQSIDTWERVRSKSPNNAQDRAVAAFMAACCAARLGDATRVRSWLDLALRDGYDKQKIQAEADLQECLKMPEIQELIGSTTAPPPPASPNSTTPTQPTTPRPLSSSPFARPPQKHP